VLVEQAGLLRELRASPLFRLDGQKGVTTLAIEQLLWAVAPRTGLDTPVGGPAIAEASWWATAGAIEELQRQERLGRPPALPELPSAADPAPTATPVAQASALPDWRALAVGFGAGVVVAVMVALQRVEWKRRRQAAAGRKQAVG
jgi:hypothetical protein